jgi:hypothetical protein
MLYTRFEDEVASRRAKVYMKRVTMRKGVIHMSTKVDTVIDILMSIRVGVGGIGGAWTC